MKTFKPIALTIVAACAGTLATASAHADDASCKPVVDALAKMANTPYHEVSTVDGKPFEKIYTTTTLSMRVAGHWTTVPMTPKEVLDVMRETGSFSSCKMLRTEMVGGQLATVYAAHHSAPGTSYPSEDSQVWIAANGLTLKSVSDAPAGSHKVHAESHMSFDNVRAPTGSN